MLFCKCPRPEFPEMTALPISQSLFELQNENYATPIQVSFPSERYMAKSQRALVHLLLQPFVLCLQSLNVVHSTHQDLAFTGLHWVCAFIGLSTLRCS